MSFQWVVGRSPGLLRRSVLVAGGCGIDSLTGSLGVDSGRITTVTARTANNRGGSDTALGRRRVNHFFGGLAGSGTIGSFATCFTANGRTHRGTGGTHRRRGGGGLLRRVTVLRRLGTTTTTRATRGMGTRTPGVRMGPRPGTRIGGPRIGTRAPGGTRTGPRTGGPRPGPGARTGGPRIGGTRPGGSRPGTRRPGGRRGTSSPRPFISGGGSGISNSAPGHNPTRVHRVSAHADGMGVRGCGRGCRALSCNDGIGSGCSRGRGVGRGSGSCHHPRNTGHRARTSGVHELRLRHVGGAPVAIAINRRVAINRLTITVGGATTRIVGRLVGLNVVTGMGRIVSCSATRVIIARVKLGVRHTIIIAVRRRVVSSARSATRGLGPEDPIIIIVKRISRNGASLLSTVHSATIASARTNNVARRVNTCEIGYGNRSVAFLSAPNRTTFASVHRHNTVTASVTILIITTSSNVVPRAVRTVGRTGTTGIRVVITVGGVSGPRTGPSHVVRRLARRRLIPRR